MGDAVPFLTATTSRSLRIEEVEDAVEEEDEEEEIPEEIETRGARWLSLNGGGGRSARGATSTATVTATATATAPAQDAGQQSARRPLIEVLSSHDMEHLD